jgi:hypothetical protein
LCKSGNRFEGLAAWQGAILPASCALAQPANGLRRGRHAHRWRLQLLNREISHGLVSVRLERAFFDASKPSVQDKRARLRRPVAGARRRACVMKKCGNFL